MTDPFNEPSLEAYKKFLEFVHERAEYGDVEYPQISKRLEQFTATDLKDMNAKWHRTCYGSTCHSGHLERARVRHQKACQQGDSQHIRKRHGRPLSASVRLGGIALSPTEHETFRLTRSAINPFNAELCFFCQEVKKETIHEVTTFNAGKQLQQAVENSSNDKWKVQLSTAISADDARAIDVKYHLSCWVKNVHRGEQTCNKSNERTLDDRNVGIVASDIEFINLVHSLLQNGKVLNMTDLKAVYSAILRCNGVPDMHVSTGVIKEKMSSHIDDLHFMKSKRRNESDQVFSTAVRDAVMDDALLKTTESSIQQLFSSASILRSAIADQAKQPWIFKGELNTDEADKTVPKALYAFIRWILEGPTTSIQTETVRSTTTHRDVLAISQNIMFCYKSKRQVTYVPKHQDAPFRHRLEWPQLLAVGIAVHQSTRSKKLLKLLHGFGLSVDYGRILRLETQLANAVIESTREVGAYVPATMRKGSFIFFAIDNSDFNEDTPDGKRTLHATATAIYQRQKPFNDMDKHNTSELRLYGTKSRDRSLKSSTTPEFIPCSAPKKQGLSEPSTFPSFVPNTISHVVKPYSTQDTAWLLSRTIMRTTKAKEMQDIVIDLPAHQLSSEIPQDAEPNLPTDTQPADMETPSSTKTIHHNISTWTAYNSLLASTKPLTEVNAMPLIASPAHEWQTLITVLKQTQQINYTVMGPNNKTVITLDMALYERAKQLEMSRDDCKGKWVLRLGEMHTVVAALRAVCNAIEDSGLEEAWFEADIYGPTTTRQILEAKHMKRALEAHMTTVQALFDLYVEELFSENPNLRGPCTNSAQLIDRSCAQRIQQDMLRDQQNMLSTLESNNILEIMKQFDKKMESISPLFKFVRRYMQMVLVIFTFIRATRDGLWQLHLSSLDELCKYFFCS
ncbi:hypothetical protein ScPMuIL_016528 [Solemya velum]